MIVAKEAKMETGEMYMSFSLLKRRYRSSDSDEKLRRLTFFHQPFEPGNDIRLLDDIDQKKPLGITSLATKFMGEETAKKRGKKNMMDREKKKKDDDLMDLEIDPFDMEKSTYL